MFGILALSVASSVLGGLQNKKNAEAQAKAAKDNYNLSLAATRSMLDTLSGRYSQASSQITRDSIRAQAAAEKAGYSAIGKQKVQAATLGTGGRRTDLYTEAEISREVGNVQTDAIINAQVQQWNLSNQLDDQSNRAINNLNNSIPNMPGEPSQLDSVINIGASILGAYQVMDKYQRADFRKEFTFTKSDAQI